MLFAPTVARYRVNGREEFLIRRGAGAAAVLLIPPLFGEMNRCRRLLADVMAALADLGRSSAMPDLPGTGESQTALEAVVFEDWRIAVAEAGRLLASNSGTPPVVASFRGGAVLDDATDAARRWRLAPVDGATVLRDLARAQRISTAVDRQEVEFAGIPLRPSLIAGLAAAPVSGHARIVRLEDDPKPADGRLAGSPLWRRAEPGRDMALAQSIAEDIDRLAVPCASS